MEAFCGGKWCFGVTRCDCSLEGFSQSHRKPSPRGKFDPTLKTGCPLRKGNSAAQSIFIPCGLRHVMYHQSNRPPFGPSPVKLASAIFTTSTPNMCPALLDLNAQLQPSHLPPRHGYFPCTWPLKETTRRMIIDAVFVPCIVIFFFPIPMFCVVSRT